MKHIIIVLVTSALISGCANLTDEDKRHLGMGAGAILGGVAGYAACGGKAACAVAGALAGAVIGGAIAKYLTEQDQENIARTLDDTENTDAVAWCSGSKHRSGNVDDVQCRGKNKVVTTPGPIAQNDWGQTCRLTKTEVETPSGEVETQDQNVCKGNDGKWRAQV